MPLRKVKAGQSTKRLPASAWNAFVDTANHVLGDRLSIRQGSGTFVEPLRVNVKNNRGSDLERANIVGLGSIVWDSSDDEAGLINQPVLNSESPNSTTHRSLFGIVENDIASEAIAEVLIAGLIVVRVNIVSTYHRYARPTTGDYTKLTSDWWGGAEILRAESGTGDKWAVVRVGAFYPHTYYGKADSAITRGSTGTISFWSGTHGSESDSGADIESCLARAHAISSAASCYVSWVGGPNNGGPEVVKLC